MSDTSPERIRVLVVDDEAPARQRLTDLLRFDASVATVLEASDGLAAVEMIDRERPDLVFLDVQMPELDGLGVIDAIGPAQMPLTVFVTAYDQHAVRAFESSALDYLLKPFSDERLQTTLVRARERLKALRVGEFAENVLRLVTAASRGERYPERLAVKMTGATHLVRVADIDWIEAAGVYVNLHLEGRMVLHRTSLNHLAAILNPARFIRVHRSTMVNIDSIVRLEPASHGEFDAFLKDGSHTRISRTYRAVLEQAVGQSL